MNVAGKMREALLPFRPKIEDSAERSLDTVRAQVTRCRRRANAFVSQRALYTIGGFVLAAFCLLIGLAFVLPRVWYAATAWGMIAALTGCAVSALVKARNDWIPRRRASITIDRRVGLEDRLATLALRQEHDSLLWGVLLRDNLRLLSRWSPQSFVPRAVPHSIWFLLLAFLLTLGLLRRIELGAESEPSAGAPEMTAAKQALDADSQAADETRVDPPLDESPLAFLSELPEQLREAILRSTRRAPAEPISRGEEHPAKGPTNAGADGTEKGRPAPEGEPGSGRSHSGENRRSAARYAPPESRGARNENSKKTAPGDARVPGLGAEPAHGDRPKSLPRVEAGRPHETAHRPLAKADRANSKGGGGQGAGAGGDRPGLFGPRDTEGSAARSFALDLAAERSRATGDREGEVDFGPRPSSDLAADQRLDDAVRRAQVPPEYEQVIQRIFSHPDEGENRRTESNLGTR